ncbi:MAG TPA: DUF47 family protein, partial [Terriglobales bacterium]|nr:DUF47 family protein [Terriglobales bacterium]
MVRIIPRDNSFFDMFAAMSNNLIDGAKALVDLFADYRDVDAKIDEIRRIEHLGDEMTHSIMRKLNQTFITPFDREDIHTLASSLDDVLDFINAACARIVMYRITDPPPEAGTLARLILAQSEELGKAVAHLQKSDHVLARCVEINRLENDAYATRLSASVALRTKMISRSVGALTNARTFSRAPSRPAVARSPSAYTPRCTFEYDVS